MPEYGQVHVHTGAGGAVLVELVGEFDVATADRLRQRLVEAAAAAGAAGVVVDLAGLTFLDSGGLGALVVGFKAAQTAGVPFRVARESPFAARLLQLSGLATLWDTPPDDADHNDTTTNPDG